MNETIQLVLREVRARNYSEVKNLLNELDIEIENLQEFFDEVDKICRELGKTNIISKDKIENLLKEYKNEK